MHFNAGFLAALGLAAGASAATHKVEVGKGGTIKFNPDTITAAKGDVVEFHFDADHSVVAADFKTPCTPASSGGFYSGTLPSGGNSFFSVTINNTDPIFFYCAVPGHCQAGMVGVINQGSDSLDDFKTAAEKTDSSKAPKSEFGGTVNDGSSSSSATKSSSEASSTGSTTATGTAASNSAASGTSSAAPSSSSGAAGHMAAGGSGLALFIGGLLAL